MIKNDLDELKSEREKCNKKVGKLFIFLFVSFILTFFITVFAIGVIVSAIIMICNSIKMIKLDTAIKKEISKEKSDIEITNSIDTNHINGCVNFENNEIKNKEVTEEYEREEEVYLKSFDNIIKYKLNRELEENFLKKIISNKEEDYEKFMKFSGTTYREFDFVVFDLETTGLSPENAEIIEIGAIRFRNGNPVEIFHTYLKPKRKITEKITSINGITNEMVKDERSIEEVLPYFIDFIGEDILIAHNAEFDMSFILQNLYKNKLKKIRNKVICTLKLSRQKIREYDYLEDKSKKLENYKLENLKECFLLYDLPSHNALDDCKVCAYVYLKIAIEDGEMLYI